MNGITIGITDPVEVAPASPAVVVLPEFAGIKSGITRKARSARVKNITKRGAIWYFKKMVGGKRKFQSLNTTDKDVASDRAKVLAAAVAGEKWAMVEGLQSKRSVATLPEVLAVFEPAAQERGLGQPTINGYMAQLWKVLRMGSTGTVGNEPSLDLLTESLVLDYQSAVLRRAGKDRMARDRARRSVQSTVTNARAVFSPWTKQVYKDLKLPDLTGFLKVALNRKVIRSYRMPAGSLVEKTIKEGRALRSTDPKLYAVFLLCYDLALRAGEAASCEWSWFSQGSTESHPTKQRVIEILRRPDFTPKWGKERRVPVSDQVWAHLQECKGADGHVLPGTAWEREALVKRTFAQWMRGQGWDRREYPKAAHELRKLMGSRWFTECGPAVAQELLGHQTVSTTCTYYAALRVQPKPLAMDFA